MKKALLLKAEIREKVGSKSARRVRAAGRIPATVYGHSKKPLAITLDAHNVVEGLHHGARIADIEIGGKKDTMLFKDLQYDYLGKNIIHIDLMRVDVTETVKVNVPIEIKGTAQGTHEGGIIEEHVDRLEIECRVTDIPENIVVLVKDVGIGDSIHAGDIELPAEMKLVSDPQLLVITCHLVAAAKSTEEIIEEMPAAPEVIGEAKEAGEAAEEKSE